MQNNINGWLNIYKPKGISSARLVSIVKKSFPKIKIGHAGTLDPEAEGVLPLALGEATKLAGMLVDASKEYIFTIQFGAKTTTGDVAGDIIERLDHFPTKDECLSVLDKFRGEIQQVPSKYSAIKIDGVRAYKLARADVEFAMKSRKVQIYDLELLDFDSVAGTARLRAECSKGTYIRTLAEDISLSLQNLGYVIELRRTRVGKFSAEDAVDLSSFIAGDWQEARPLLEQNLLRLELVLDDIPVLEASEEQVKQIKFGQKVFFETFESDQENVDQEHIARKDITQKDIFWVRFDGQIVAIGSLQDDGLFKSQRVFNLI